MQAPCRGLRARVIGGLALLLAGASTVLATSALGAAGTRPGSPAKGFGRSGLAGAGAGVRLLGTAIEPDGKILAVGESGAGRTQNPRLLLVRFTSKGALDRSFGARGVARGPALSGTLGIGTGSVGRAVAIEPSGKIIVVGYATSKGGIGSDGLVIERFTASGHLDRSFGRGGVDELLAGTSGAGYAVALEPGGQIIAAGSAETAGSGGVAPRLAVVRVKESGSLDPSFGHGGIAVIDVGPDSSALAVALQSNGAILLAGSQRPGLQVPEALLVRLTHTGALDRSFAGTGTYTHQYARGAASSGFDAVDVQSNGAIVAAGSATQGGNGADMVVARFSRSGAPQRSFGSGGVVYATSAVNFLVTGTTVPGASGVAIAPDGTIFAAGTEVNGAASRAAIWAFTPGGSPNRRFGSSGRVLTSYGSDTVSEADALALAPDGDLVTAGDGQPAYNGTYTGFVEQYIGFGSVGRHHAFARDITTGRKHVAFHH
jgi:uncharacterized delta-60 repeat protein